MLPPCLAGAVWIFKISASSVLSAGRLGQDLSEDHAQVLHEGGPTAEKRRGPDFLGFPRIDENCIRIFRKVGSHRTS